MGEKEEKIRYPASRIGRNDYQLVVKEGSCESKGGRHTDGYGERQFQNTHRRTESR